MAQGNWSSLLIIMTCINMFMYIGLGTQDTFLFEGDLLDQLTVMKTNITSESLDAFLEPGASKQLELSENISRKPVFSSLSNVPGISVVAAFLDGLEIVKQYILTLFNIIFAPITLFFYGDIPFFIGFLMLPYSLIYITSIIQFIRGAS